MRIGITVLPDLPWTEASRRWRACEELGFDHAWTYDHLVWGGLPDRPWGGATPVLAAAAAVTSTIRLGTLVASPNFRHPYQLFRDAQALEEISGGRFVLGLGAGGNLDAEVLGGPAPALGDRVARFFEMVEVLRRLRSEDHVDHAGRFFATQDARTVGGLARTPYLVAANGPRSVRFAAAAGDGWVTTGPSGPVGLEEWFAGLARSAAQFDEALEAAGRDPGPVWRAVNVDATPHLSGPSGSAPTRFALSSVDFFTEMVGRCAELGFTDVITHWPRAQTAYVGSERVLEQVAADVLPRWRDSAPPADRRG